MVALKPCRVSVMAFLLSGSRNAVVALKHERGRRRNPPPDRSRNAVVALKLRGVDHPQLVLLGSRNAVVALKRGQRLRSKSWTRKKQERRGGIETRWRVPSMARTTRKKQERRGGIETPVASRFLPQGPPEAGTPWWH